MSSADVYVPVAAKSMHNPRAALDSHAEVKVTKSVLMW